MKNKRIQKNIVILLTLLFVPFFAHAQETPRLEVLFTPDPLFSEQNILPGDSVSGLVTVSNNSGEEQEVIVEAINISDPYGLSTQMELIITDENDVVLYDETFGTFFDFLTEGPLTLTSTLLDGGNAEYTFDVSFLSDTETHQLTELGFDLCVGFKNELSGTNCGDTVVSSEGNTGGETDTVVDDNGTTVSGSGGGVNPNTPALQIFNEEVTSIDDVLGTAVITWDTNLFSTSQVVYGLASDGPFSLSAVDTMFGYPNATPEDTAKVLEHSVLLTGLIPGETYNFRVVSRASPPTVSYEYSFVVVAEPVGIVQTQDQNDTNNFSTGGKILASNNTPISQTSISTTTTSTTSVKQSSQDNTQSENQALNQDRNNATDNHLTSAPEGFMAAAFLSGIFNGNYEYVLYALLSLIIIVVALNIYRGKNTRFVKTREEEKILHKKETV